jgi:hypothetical protein
VNFQGGIAIACLVVVGFLLYLSTGEPSAEPSRQWPDRLEAIFLDSCAETGTNRSACECLRDELEPRIGLTAIATKTPTAERVLKQATRSCVSNRID